MSKKFQNLTILSALILSFHTPQYLKAEQTQTSPTSTRPSASVGAEASLSEAMSSVQSADKASDEQSKGSGQNMIMGSGMIVIGATLLPELATAPIGAALIAQGVMGLLQAANQSGTSDGNNQAAGNFTTGGNNSGTGSGSGTSGSGNGSGSAGATGTGLAGKSDPFNRLSANAKAALKKITDLGYKVDFKNNTLTTPDGTVITPADAANGSALEAKLNLPPGTADKTNALIDQIAKKNGISSDGDAAGGGAGSYASEGDGSGLAQGEGYDGSGGKAGANSNPANRQPASALVAGLSTTYNGERIGVASDDIFMMVTRRYQVKQGQDSFLSLEPPGGSSSALIPRKK